MAETSCRHLSAPGLPPGWGRSWLMLLLAVHILHLFSAIHEAAANITAIENITIEVTTQPVIPREGEDVLLIPKGSMDNAVFCLWYKGDADLTFPIFRYTLEPYPTMQALVTYDGRQTPEEDCGMRIRNVSFMDIGTYGIEKGRVNISEIGHTFLQVAVRRQGLKKGLSAGAVAGVAAGCVVGTLLAAGLVTYHNRKLFNPEQFGSRRSSVHTETELQRSVHSVASEKGQS